MILLRKQGECLHCGMPTKIGMTVPATATQAKAEIWYLVCDECAERVRRGWNPDGPQAELFS